MTLKPSAVQNAVLDEQKKRRKEIISIFVLSIILAFLVGLEVYVFRSGQALPSPYIIYFIGLVNINLILVLFLLFLIFRNVVKVFIERRGRIFGSSLKSKLILAFATFSVIPTTLVIVLSLFYLNSSFDKWFSQRMIGIMKNASEVIDSLIEQEKVKGYSSAEFVAQELNNLKITANKKNLLQDKLNKIQNNYKIDAIEFFPSLLGERYLSQDSKLLETPLPRPHFDFLQKGFLHKSKASYIQVFSNAHLIRMMVPAKEGVVVVSKILNLPPGAKFDDILGAYQEFRSNTLIESPLKSIFFTMQIVMSLVILFAAVWFGFYMAKQLSIPLVQLGRATRRVAGGDYTELEIESGSDEINNLIKHFNQMIKNLSSSEIELQQTIKNLNQYTRYVEIVLGNVSAGVLSIDNNGVVTTLNRRASELLSLDPLQTVNKPMKQALSEDNFKIFSQFIHTMKEAKLTSLQKEVRIEIQKNQDEPEPIPLSVHVSTLKNEFNEEIGLIVVFDDMSPIVNAQRAAAWSEVARRIAHEIKNPLTPIRLAAERISRKYSQQISDPAFQDSVQMIVSQVDDMRNLVNEFAQFARMPQLKPVQGQLNQVLKQMVENYQQNHPQIEFIQRLDDQLPEFKFDPAQFKRVLVNLIDNAVHATEEQIELLKKENKSHSTSQPILNRVEIITEYMKQHKVARVFITDTGIGIPVRDRARVFEPYFSTKEKGTGLGLPIVKSIVEDHGGIIRALGHEPRGTKIMIEIPLFVSHSQ